MRCWCRAHTLARVPDITTAANRCQKADAVLCPVCKRDYLVQAGPPSASIVCACGFRLDTAGDRLGLEHLRQQLAETYSQHR